VALPGMRQMAMQEASDFEEPKTGGSLGMQLGPEPAKELVLVMSYEQLSRGV